MPNKASKAGHIPERTCVICRKKEIKKNLVRFIIMKNNYVIDNRQELQDRGFYLCDNNECLGGLDKWLIKKSKKKLKKRKISVSG